jgi:hypothetical protein
MTWTGGFLDINMMRKKAVVSWFVKNPMKLLKQALNCDALINQYIAVLKVASPIALS